MSLHYHDIMDFVAEMGTTSVALASNPADLRGAMKMAIEDIEHQGVMLETARRLFCRLTAPSSVFIADIDWALTILDSKMHADAEILWYTSIPSGQDTHVVLLMAGRVIPNVS